MAHGCVQDMHGALCCTAPGSPFQARLQQLCQLVTSKGKMQKKAMGMKIVSAYPAHTRACTSRIWPCTD